MKWNNRIKAKYKEIKSKNKCQNLWMSRDRRWKMMVGWWWRRKVEDETIDIYVYYKILNKKKTEKQEKW